MTDRQKLEAINEILAHHRLTLNQKVQKLVDDISTVSDLQFEGYVEPHPLISMAANLRKERDALRYKLSESETEIIRLHQELEKKNRPIHLIIEEAESFVESLRDLI